MSSPDEPAAVAGRVRLPVLALAVLVGLVSLYAFVLGVSLAWPAGRLLTAGTTATAAVLRAVSGPDGPEVRVFFLDGVTGHTSQVAASDPLPAHGTRLDVTYLPGDPEGSVTRADEVRPQLVRGLLLVVVGAAGTAAAVVVAVRTLTRGRPGSRRTRGGGGCAP